MKTNQLFFVAVWVWLMSFQTNAQSSGYNYISTLKLTDPNGIGLQTVQYYDGLGRPDLQVLVGVTSSGKDLGSLIEYDRMERDSLFWKALPTGTTGGDYVPNFRTAIGSYLQEKPYVQSLYETSPLGR